LFHAAVDARIAFVCSSGAACSYDYKMKHEIGLEMALVIPSFAAQWDFHHLIQCIAPRPLLIVSADEDPSSMDADLIVENAKSAYLKTDNLSHYRYSGTHAMTQERFDAIKDWILQQVNL
jgi:spore coat polysaccharide biosynthesis predicted glycosyltransferase SpsG